MIRFSNLLPYIILFLFFMNVWRAFVIDSLNLLVAATVAIYGFAALKVLTVKTVRISNFDILISIALIVLALGFIANYNGDDILKDVFLYHLTALLFLPFIILAKGSDPKSGLVLIFSVIFWADSAVIALELIDSLVGFEIHRIGLFNWYIETNDPGRFLQLKINSGSSFYDDLPPVLGLRGYPNYTAPLFTASFLFLLAVMYSKSEAAGTVRLGQIIFFLFGVCLVLVLGVKTHFVTLLIGCIFIGKYLNKKMKKDLLVASLGVVAFIVTTEVGMNKAVLLYEQLFIGGYQAIESRAGGPRIFEPGRLETILNLSAYLSFLDLSLNEFIFGASNFLVLQQWDIFFEQKILVIGLVLGAPFVAILLIMSIRALYGGFGHLTLSKNNTEKGIYCGVFLAILVLILEMGHFGATFYYPNFQIFVYLIAISVVAYRNRRTKGIVMKAAIRDA